MVEKLLDKYIDEMFMASLELGKELSARKAAGESLTETEDKFVKAAAMVAAVSVFTNFEKEEK